MRWPGSDDVLSAERISAGLNTAFVGRSLVYLAEVGSTNEVARQLAMAGAPDGTLVVADYQTAGRGRLGRRWESPPGTGLLLSLLWRCGSFLDPNQVQALTMACGLAAADAVECVTGLSVDLKWPNDLGLRGAKLGGILTEIELCGPEIEYAVVGLGLNVNMRAEQFPAALPTPATSLAIALGRPLSRLPLLWAILRAVEERYQALRRGLSPYREWADRLVTMNQLVTVSGPELEVEGIAEGVNGDGALLVRCADGSLRTVIAGDVTLRCGPGVSSAATSPVALATAGGQRRRGSQAL